MTADRPRAAIFDMDGTLCDVSSLRHHVDRNHPDVEVKRDILTEIRQAYDPVVAVDDNPAIIELWESEGITAHVIAGHRG